MHKLVEVADIAVADYGHTHSKEFGKFAGLSFYANNVLYYEPFMSTNTSGTLTQRNSSSYSFGVELFFNL